MATYHGKDGKVLIGANQVGEVIEFTHNEAAEVADDTAKGDAWNSHLVGHKSADGSVACLFDHDDTNGQAAMTIGASVNLKLYPVGDDTGDKEIDCTSATITSLSVSSPLRDVVRVDFGYQVNGAVTHGTVS